MTLGPRNGAALEHVDGDEAVVAGLKMEAAWGRLGRLGLGVVVMPDRESGPRVRRSS